MKDLTRKEMEDLLLEHEIAELEYDLDRTMATLVSNPHFELPTLGLAIDGWEGVKAMYSHFLMKGGRERNMQAVARIIAEARNTLMREAWVSYDNLEGKRVTGVYMVVVEFDPELKKIVGERMYADTIYTDLLKELFGENIGSLPGSSPISDSTPIIDVHDAFEAAAARGIAINNPHVKPAL
ncbi:MULTISPECIES: hypothetical protein [unclassified Sphingomonas]|uniref:hypothetical protein n=1 Tax=unclassified Sphingomonas TaxID=196159 RepID=UPI001AC7431A|nr:MULTISPECIES: hypothetical protein [unclassified Sphingomonas]MBN8847127.1 hypothetical protein [Sphingomonas sp.]